MNKLTKYSFTELYDMSSGISTKPSQARHGAPFVSFSTVFNNYFLPEVLEDLMDTSAKEQETYSIREGDIFITRTSETIDELAMSCVVLKDYPKAAYSGFVKRLRPKTSLTYHKYLAFYLRGYLFRKTVTNNAFMTLRASFNEDIFSFIDIYLPDYKQQTLIGDLLFLIEQKIQLNNKIISELEAMAKAIYDYWFVQFDFPDENGNPYRTSGGEMVYNKQLKIEIPKGWEVDTLEKNINIIRGVTYAKTDVIDIPKSNYVKLMRANNIANGMLNYDSIVYVTKDRIADTQYLTANCVFLCMSSGSIDHIGKTALITTATNLSFGAFCSKIEIESKLFCYLGIYFRSQYFNLYIRNMCLGTNINNLNNEILYGILLPFPKEHISLLFNKKVLPILEKQGILQSENQELTKLRDWLLPMLMNGQATVEPEK